MNEKKQTIILVSLVLGIITGIYLYRIQHLESQISTLMIDSDARELNLTVETLQRYSYTTYKTRINNLLHSDPAISKAFAERNRTQLYEHTRSKYEALKRENPYLYLMQFHLPDGTTFLRMHQPDLSGEAPAVVQPIIAAVHHSQTPHSGFEFCHQGLFFRVVHPIFVDDIYIGALEIGLRPQQLIEAVEKNLGEKVVSYFLRKEYQRTIQAQNQPVTDIGKFIIEGEETSLIKLLSPQFFQQDNDQIIQNEGLSYRVHNHQIFNNFNNESLGGIIFFQDISEPIHRKQFFLWSATLISLLLFLITATALYISFERILTSLVREIASRKQAEGEILDRETRIRLLLDSTADGIFGLDHVGKCTFVNESCLRLLGYNHEDELLGFNLHELIHHHRPDGSEFSNAECPMCDSYQHGREVTVNNEVLWRKDGQPIPVEYHSSPIKQDNCLLGAVISFSDISKRKQVEDERGRLAAAVEHAADEIIITNLKGVIEYVNPAFERVTGYSRQEAIGKKPSILQSGKHPKEFYQHLWQTIQSGKIWSSRIINKIKNGCFIEEDATISPIFSTSGHTIGYVAVKRDVTEKVKMEERLQQSSKMEALGTLAGTIAHDFNNILNGINGFTSLALVDVPPQSKVAKHLQGVMKASATATELVQQILAFSRKNDTVFTHLTIQDIIKDVINLLRRSIPQSVQICDQIDMECGPIYGNKSQIHQILMNLGTNASHAMRKNGGVLTILLKEGIGEDQKKNVQLQIMDTGEGIAPDVLEQMFEPYFTTKKEGEGTGLGLSTVHKIVKNHHGNIKVESEPGEGTVFTLHFPLATTEVDRDSITIPATPPEAATGHILFVDDAVINVILGQEILQNAGYTVIGLSDSVEALELFRQQPEEFDLVVTDQQMPKLTGMQMAREMIQIRPDIPILMVSGDEDTEIDPEIRQSGIRENIPKPLSVTTLLTAAAREIQKGRKG